MTAPVFQPGKFQPVLTLGVTAQKEPTALCSDFSGIERIATESFRQSAVRSRGAGGGLDVVVQGFASDAKIIYHFLTARNLAEQLREVEKFHTQVTTPLVNAKFSVLEPIAKAYTYYGHFERDEHVYSEAAIRDKLARHIVSLAKYTTQQRTIAGSANDHAGNLEDVDFNQLTFADTGEIMVTRTMPYEDRKREIIATILQNPNVVNCDKFALIREATELSTERGLATFVRYLATGGINVVFQPQPDPIGNVFRNALRTLLEDPTITVGDGDRIRARSISSIIARASLCIQRITDSLSFRMKTTELYKYEGGTKIQLAYVAEMNLYSEEKLSADETTVAFALGLHRVKPRRNVLIPGDTPESILREIVALSLID